MNSSEDSHVFRQQYDTWRIIVGNINSFPTDNKGSNQYKLDKLQKLLKENNIDIAMISEHNRNLEKVSHSDQPVTILKRWWPQTIVRSAFLRSDNSSTFEPGGTMIITHSRSTAHTCKAGEDVHWLGRWNFITLKGKNNTYTTIISIYRPASSQETHSRQVAHSCSKRRKMIGNTTSTENLWYSDLSDLIQGECAKGYNVIVAGDFNDNLNDSTCTTRNFMRNLGLREIMLERVKKGPATYSRGTNTIDGIFATCGIHIVDGRYSSFDQSPSDHRWITIDILDNILIGTPRDDKCPPLLRKTTSKIPSVKENFQLELEKHVIQHKLHLKISELYNEAIMTHALTDQQQKTYEQIENTLQRGVKSADNKCRKARRGMVPFSPHQKKLMGKILILKQYRLRWVLKKHKNRPRSRAIKRMISKYDYDGPTSFNSLDLIDNELRKAYTLYQEFKRCATRHRWSYLEQIASEYNEKDGKGIQHHFKILQQQEQSREYFRRIRFCEGKTRKGGVDKIQIEADGNTYITYDKQQIEQEIMKVNQAKLLQARHTPLCKEHISVLLGEQGNFEKWEEILKGTIDLPTDVDEGLRVWYNYLTTRGEQTHMDITWTTEDYINSWSKMKEDKTTLPGIQVAHIKCLDHKSLSADVISKLSLIPFITGYSPKIWQEGIDSMIPKKVADLRPEKLRLILLMDARFNHNNKLIGKKMMEYGESNNLLAPEQFGSRKHKAAPDHAVNKRFTMDLLRQTGTSAIYIANDAKSCYDRIILMVAYLTMRTFGIPATVAQSTIYSILNMKHRVRTIYGDSKEYYGGDKWEVKPHGCGQGNGYGPALWACISSPLLHILRQQGYGTKFQTPLSKKLIHLAAFSFVDDTDIFQTEPVNDDSYNLTLHRTEELYSKSQNTLDLWSKTLAATGGELEPTKTFYVPIIPRWKGNKVSLVDDASCHPLTITDPNGKSTTIARKKSDEPFFSLGIWQISVRIR